MARRRPSPPGKATPPLLQDVPAGKVSQKMIDRTKGSRDQVPPKMVAAAARVRKERR